MWGQIQRTAARAAEERYRKELEAHAGAITALRNAEDAQDVSNPPYPPPPPYLGLTVAPCVLGTS